MASEHPPSYDPKNMQFRQFGRAGIKVSLFSLGGWLTYGGSVQGDPVKDIIKTAWEHGINTFDTAEVYSAGECERQMGKAFKDLKLKREEIVLITKVCFGTKRKDPNQSGLSRKHIIEGLRESLARLDTPYVDVLKAHRPDPTVPMEEVVRAFSFCIDQGWVFYWGTSQWSAAQIEEAFLVAERLGLHPPIADQCKHSALSRGRVEKELLPVIRKRGYGTSIWSPLHGGLLTGKYNDGIPKGSRYDHHKDMFDDTLKQMKSEEGIADINRVRKLSKVADKLGCSVTALSLAWAAKNEDVSTVILGATKPEQLVQNLEALDVLPKLTHEVMQEIEGVLDNKP